MRSPITLQPLIIKVARPKYKTVNRGILTQVYGSLRLLLTIASLRITAKPKIAANKLYIIYIYQIY